MGDVLDGRAWLREVLQGWPNAVGAEGEAFLRALPYRVRRAVELVYGRGLRAEHAASVLGVSERTVAAYLRLAHLRAARLCG